MESIIHQSDASERQCNLKNQITERGVEVRVMSPAGQLKHPDPVSSCQLGRLRPEKVRALNADVWLLLSRLTL